MMFCKKCGSIMMPAVSGKQTILKCSCGYTSEGTITLKEAGQKSADIGVTEDKDLNPLTDAICKKCGHTKAHYWIVQTRSADEAPTRFFKCQKCKHTWREKS